MNIEKKEIFYYDIFLEETDITSEGLNKNKFFACVGDGGKDTEKICLEIDEKQKQRCIIYSIQSLDRREIMADVLIIINKKTLDELVEERIIDVPVMHERLNGSISIEYSTFLKFEKK